MYPRFMQKSSFEMSLPASAMDMANGGMPMTTTMIKRLPATQMLAPPSISKVDPLWVRMDDLLLLHMPKTWGHITIQIMVAKFVAGEEVVSWRSICSFSRLLRVCGVWEFGYCSW
jgi:hypothetical protein